MIFSPILKNRQKSHFEQIDRCSGQPHNVARNLSEIRRPPQEIFTDFSLAASTVHFP